MKGLVWWDGGWVVVGLKSHFYLDPASGKARAVKVPGCEQIHAFATFGGVPVVLCSHAGREHLALKRGDRWWEREVPEAANTTTRPLTMAADGESLALLQSGYLHRLDRRGRWRTKAIESSGAGAPVARSALLHGDTLFVGYGDGEFGSGIWALDLGSGDWREIIAPLGQGSFARHERYILAQAFQMVPHGGRFWAVAAFEPDSHLFGEVLTFDFRDWQLVAAVSGATRDMLSLYGLDPARSRPDTVAWDQPADAFQGLAFDDEGRPMVLGQELGVVRRDSAGHWTKLTPGWVAGTAVAALGIKGTTLIIVTYLAGVVLWDFATGEVRKVKLGAPG